MPLPAKPERRVDRVEPLRVGVFAALNHARLRIGNLLAHLRECEFNLLPFGFHLGEGHAFNRPDLASRFCCHLRRHLSDRLHLTGRRHLIHLLQGRASLSRRKGRFVIAISRSMQEREEEAGQEAHHSARP
jgi:hypothetical protein